MRIPETGNYEDFKAAVMALPYTIADEHVLEETGYVRDGKIQLEWIPVRAGTLVGVIGSHHAYDDSDGRIVCFSSGEEVKIYQADIYYSCGEIIDLPHALENSPYSFAYFWNSDARLKTYQGMPLNWPMPVELREARLSVNPF